MLTLSGQNGGGQILRSSLTLSMITGQPFRLAKIRGARPKPGLARQHLTCVTAAKDICHGAVDGAEPGSTEIIFHPGKVSGGNYEFSIGTAGSTTLLAQTLLPALWQAENTSHLILKGGTHNPMAPTMDFITRVFLPALKTMDVEIDAELHRYGFFPAGGGEISFRFFEDQKPKQVELLKRGELLEQRIHCLCAHLLGPISEKETSALRKKLDWPENTIFDEHTENADCQGNALAAEVRFEKITERCTVLGQRGKPSERVAANVAKMMSIYLESGAVVGRHLADQLLLPMALAGGGSIITSAPSNHVKTNIEVIQTFLPVRFETEELEKGTVKISVQSD